MELRIRKQRNLVQVATAVLRMALTAVAAGFIAYALGSADYALIGAGVLGILLALTRSNNNVAGIKDEDFLFLFAIPVTAVVAVIAFPAMALMVGQTALLIIGTLLALAVTLVALVVLGSVILAVLGFILAVVRRFIGWALPGLGNLLVTIIKFVFVDLVGELAKFVGGFIGGILYHLSNWAFAPIGFILRRMGRKTDWIANLNKRAAKPAAAAETRPAMVTPVASATE